MKLTKILHLLFKISMYTVPIIIFIKFLTLCENYPYQAGIVFVLCLASPFLLWIPTRFLHELLSLEKRVEQLEMTKKDGE